MLEVHLSFKPIHRLLGVSPHLILSAMKVKVFGVLRKYTDGKKVVEVTVTSETKVKDVIAMLNIPDQFVSLVESGGKTIAKDAIVDDASEITLVPLVHGG